VWKKTGYDILLLWRRAITAPVGTNQHTQGHNNVMTQPERGNTLAYTLDRLVENVPPGESVPLVPIAPNGANGTDSLLGQKQEKAITM
jgi:hypothetical protein